MNDEGQKVYIIKKRPVPKSASLGKAVGYGASGMMGTGGLATAVYFVITKIVLPKLKAMKLAKDEKKEDPSRQPSAKVHPVKAE